MRHYELKSVPKQSGPGPVSAVRADIVRTRRRRSDKCDPYRRDHPPGSSLGTVTRPDRTNPAGLCTRYGLRPFSVRAVLICGRVRMHYPGGRGRYEIDIDEFERALFGERR